MLKKIIAAACMALSVMAIEAADKGESLYLANRAPLLEKRYMELPVGDVKPEGWLKDQMQRMADGMTGHLDKLYEPVMGKRNGWLGGDGDVWERGPYWIDGFLPLAYMLDDKVLKEKVQPWVEWALNSQREDGYFGPDTDRSPEAGLQRDNAQDWWPKMVVLKVLQQYYDATGDKRVIPFMTKYFKYQLEHLKETPLGHWTYWGRMRGGDNLLVVYWLYNITGDDFLLELGDVIAEQTYNWRSEFLNREMMHTIGSVHCVNLAQGLKEPVVRYQATHDEKDIASIDTMAYDLRRFHGWPTGLYGGDEWMHGGNPTQGSELCTAVEMMYSLEKMIEITGRTDWADWLERVAFNALPTQMSDDCMTRQYYQQLNQVEVSCMERNFQEPHGGTDIAFGLLTGYPCCTSNLHQGWPKFTRDLWFATSDRGLAALYYAPSTVTAKVGNGVEVKIEEKTMYPFEGTVRFEISYPNKKVKSADFPLELRVPGWCKEATVKVNGAEVSKGNAGSIITLDRTWKKGDKVELEMPMQISTSRWYENSTVIERGPLLYALRIGEEWQKVTDQEKLKGRGDYCYEVHATTPWNYCLMQNDVDNANVNTAFKVVERKTDGYPWSIENAPIEIHGKGRRMENWTLYNGSAGPMPYGPIKRTHLGDVEDIVLIPYGCTTLRITEFPVAR